MRLKIFDLTEGRGDAAFLISGSTHYGCVGPDEVPGGADSCNALSEKPAPALHAL